MGGDVVGVLTRRMDPDNMEAIFELTTWRVDTYLIKTSDRLSAVCKRL